MYHTTGFTEDEIIDLCALVHAHEENCDIDPWPPSPGLYKSVVIALTYMRRNRVQQELAETCNTSQPAISRANSRITPRLAVVLAPFVPTADDLDPDTQYIYDGTLLPCWSWRGHRELYSGKHKTTGKNVQVACNLQTFTDSEETSTRRQRAGRYANAGLRPHLVCRPRQGHQGTQNLLNTHSPRMRELTAQPTLPIDAHRLWLVRAVSRLRHDGMISSGED